MTEVTKMVLPGNIPGAQAILTLDTGYVLVQEPTTDVNLRADITTLEDFTRAVFNTEISSLEELVRYLKCDYKDAVDSESHSECKLTNDEHTQIPVALQVLASICKSARTELLIKIPDTKGTKITASVNKSQTLRESETRQFIAKNDDGVVSDLTRYVYRVFGASRNIEVVIYG